MENEKQGSSNASSDSEQSLGGVGASGAICLVGFQVNSHPPETGDRHMAIPMIRRARMFENAASILMASESELTLPIAHMLGHSLEVGLKAFLLSQGLTNKELSGRALGHNLIEVWSCAASKGLQIEAEPPE